MFRVANRPLFQGLNAWRETAAEMREKKTKMTKAFKSIVASQARKGLNSWMEVYREEKAKREKIKAAMKRMSPEGKAMRIGILKLKEVGTRAQSTATQVTTRRLQGILATRRLVRLAALSIAHPTLTQLSACSVLRRPSS